eukprot:TRINITY_DN73258_c0_g1_i1.p1 TRINITY_DN73258_c0_g1~~TRINITY_DN73258_c0_g1_i1.p1  ORF type:complete len:365 (-),score=69.81 TRINITY_DN73258_c0_g1_i1:103-1197(-)
MLQLAMFLGVVSALLSPGASAFAVEETVKPLRIKGRVTAVLTDYNDDGSLNLQSIPEMAKFQRRMGVAGVFVGGTTGDSVAMTLAERKALAEAWAPEARAQGLTFIVHVGAEALGDAVDLAQHAERIGADAIGAMPSIFFKPATVEIAAMWLQKIGAAAPKLPLYYYHIPSMTGVVFKMLDLIKAVEQVGVPQFVGVKYTGLYEPQCWIDFERCRAYKGGRYEVFCGREEMTVQALAVGTEGFIGSQMNFAADVYASIASAWPNATRALQIQAVGQNLLTSYMGILPSGVKGEHVVMEYAGLPMGSPRLPSLAPDPHTKKQLRDVLTSWCRDASDVLGRSPELCKAHHELEAKSRELQAARQSV